MLVSMHLRASHRQAVQRNYDLDLPDPLYRSRHYTVLHRSSVLRHFTLEYLVRIRGHLSLRCVNCVFIFIFLFA